MRLTAIFLTAFCIHVCASSYEQGVSIKAKDEPLTAVLKTIERQTGLSFFFNYAIMKDVRPVTLDVKDMPWENLLGDILGSRGLGYYKNNRTVFIIKSSQPAASENQRDLMSSTKVEVIGHVTDQSGIGLAGATVATKDRKRSTLTNEKGDFVLKDVQSDGVLIISYTGYRPSEVPVTPGAPVDVKLMPADNKLDEVQVIAYGNTTERMSVGDVTTVKGTDIEKQNIDNPLLALEGRVPGLVVTQASGTPGTAVTVQIQGQNSIANGNDPLYVVDGIPYISQMLPGLGGGILGYSGVGGTPEAGNPLNYINPADVESISVLKDADATSIYGSRAANGAVLITTKKGKSGQTKVDVNLQNGWGQITRRLNLLNTTQYLAMRHEAISNDGLTVDGGPFAAYGFKDFDLDGTWDTTRYTDWQKKLIGRTAESGCGSISISGGNATTQYLVGGTYRRETTVFPGDFSDNKSSFHFNINNTSINQRFHLQVSGNYLVDNNALPAVDFTNMAIRLAPDGPKLYNADGTLNWELDSAGANTWTNPLSYNYLSYSNKTDNLIGAALLKYDLLPGLSIQSNLGYTKIETNENSLTQSLYYSPSIRSLLPTSAKYANNTVKTWIVEPQLLFSHFLLGGKLESLLGTTFQQTNSNGLQIQGTGYTSDAVLANPQAAANVSIMSSTISSYKYNAVFGRLNYNFKDKYILNAGIRDDGSSRFGGDNEFHTFGSLGAAWIFSNEAVLKNGLPFLSYGKVRASYGTVGNDQIGDYQFLTLYNNTYAQVPYQGVTGLQPTSLPNPHLQWELTKKAELGIDLGIIHDRVLINVNYYDNHSSNQLLAYALANTTGFTFETANFPATVMNDGWEFQVTSANMKTNTFSWTTRFNITIPSNKLVQFPGISSSSYADQLVVGRPITSVKVYRYLSVNSDTGIYQFQGRDGKPTFSPDTLNDLVNLAPKYFGAIENSFTYQGFELDFLFQFVKQLGPTYYYGFYPGNFNGGLGNQPRTVLNRWQHEGDMKPIQRFNSNFSLNPQFMDLMSSNAGYTDASFIRLKNLSLSWGVPKKLLKTLRFSNARIFISAQNLLTITNYRGLDPETKNTSLIPPLRMLTSGISVSL